MKGKYLGIDESNHGKFPEIFVAVCSDDEKDIIKIPEEKSVLPKSRADVDFLISLSDRIFRHYLVMNYPESDSAAEEIKIISFSKLINSFEGLEKVIIDGALKDSVIERIYDGIESINPPKIIAEPHADQRYPIVNVADIIAYKLFKHYSSNRMHDDKKFSRYLNSLIGTYSV